MEKVLLVKEFMDGHGGSMPYPEQTGEAVGPCSQVGKLADVLQSMMLASLEWILLCTISYRMKNFIFKFRFSNLHRLLINAYCASLSPVDYTFL